MKNIFVNAESAEYNIYFDSGFDGLSEVLRCSGRVCIITDSNVAKLYLDEVKSLIHNTCRDVYDYVFEAGEKSKNLDTVKAIYEFLLNNHFDRKSLLIALGGGVTGDLTGFVAATYMRGIEFVQIPTTLLAQIDSSIGGKTGVDFLGSKNLIGAFHQPKLVYTNINTLKTLDKKQFSSGMAEVIKHGLIMSRDYFDFITANKEEIQELSFDIMQELIINSCMIKKSVVEQDEKEKGLREILNFGHTFGHSVETLSDFKLTHGHSVAIGMVCSAYYALQNDFITKDEFYDIKNILEFFDLPNLINNFDEKQVISQMYLDKKTKNNVISIITLKKIGEALSIKISDEKILSACIKQLGV